MAKDICLESTGVSVCGVLGNNGGSLKKKNTCNNCKTKEHSDAGFTVEIRKKLCKAFSSKCGKCNFRGH